MSASLQSTTLTFFIGRVRVFFLLLEADGMNEFGTAWEDFIGVQMEVRGCINFLRLSSREESFFALRHLCIPASVNASKRHSQWFWSLLFLMLLCCLHRSFV